MKLYWKIAICILVLAIIGGSAGTLIFKAKQRQRQRRAAEACLLRAEKGDVASEMKLGRFYYYGLGVKQDYGQAFRWFSKAADQNDPKAQADLGYMYEWGKGLPPDLDKALALYRKAANRGNPKAQLNLGAIYYYGKGVAKDQSIAAGWYLRAANQGLASAEYDIGSLYYWGEGVPQDRTKADLWFHRAADQGDAEAIHVLAGRRLGFWDKVWLITAFMGELWILGGIFLSRNVANKGYFIVVLAGLLLMGYVGLRLYQAFGRFHSMFAADAVNVAALILGGVGISLLLVVVGRIPAKLGLFFFSLLFLTANFLLAASRFRHLPTPHAVYSVDILSVSIWVPIAIYLWWSQSPKNLEGTS